MPVVRRFLLRDVRGLIEALTARRQRMFASTAKALTAAAEASSSGGEINPVDIAGRIGVDPEDLKAWFGYLGIGSQPDFKLDLLTEKIEKTGAYDFVQGWGTSKTPMLLANSSNEHVRVPGNMKASRRGSPSFANSERRRRMAQPRWPQHCASKAK